MEKGRDFKELEFITHKDDEQEKRTKRGIRKLQRNLSQQYKQKWYIQTEESIIDEHISEQQKGARKERSRAHNIVVIKAKIKLDKYFWKTTYLQFDDIKKCFSKLYLIICHGRSSQEQSTRKTIKNDISTKCDNQEDPILNIKNS